ncbi:alpha-1,2-fucosyltransferase [Mucilaginibacter sp. AW1-7]|uniref:alpha-1,2-fucosyltransferase n=1 Tax=Mucilaginibacter sp. AW1-7 TaxID=3349874 RepID=UPI003F733256
MIGITIDCRLGNQLFQYAFIRDLSQQLNTPFFVNEAMMAFTAADYFEFDGYHPAANFWNKLYFKLRYGSPFKSLQSIALDHYQEDEFAALPDGRIYRGYFQSEVFFKNIRSAIPAYIRVKERHAARFKKKYAQVFADGPVIAVHIRRGDYLNLNSWWEENLGSTDLTLSVSYYRQCLGQISDLGKYRVIFVSDDIEFVRLNFADVNNAIFAGDDLIMDFQVLMNADICIVANSSFAWWAAYLNPKGHKRVYCPRYWLGFKTGKQYPADIIPPAWIQIDVATDDAAGPAGGTEK